MHRIAILSLALALSLMAGCAGDRSEAEGDARGEPASTQELQPANVPEGLRELIPLAEKWGIGDDVDRAALIERSSTEERQALTRSIAPHQDEITAWLDSFGTSPLSDEAAAFMYMQLAVEEMRYY
ncbi:MAG: hypothetical protein GWN99_08710 [Gemmatimonadetes bacterium]|uniref:Uncharacterized protein n=1 Tax=Candidatus Kutchimonas denitrificans TaxID=3056748 RepID=A0AAE5CCW8_9BACT|nr:hypothetical protein [Gemmatimonadota bacterium]NIR76578.1 hypothetical protein [Candidatus Kutchimonas denitrificans]NIS01134.1 hypothetical protein [Gemmatimonadota bacterium]NIT66901.1 hypothetical protein [Gemmatimonadota bacterium]NIU54674.1 hypothetical protein [Gemmatimonadota bacterium]